MAWTQTDIDALKTAIASGKGAQRITFGDQTVWFNTPGDMLALLAAMEREANSPVTHRLAVTSKGL